MCTRREQCSKQEEEEGEVEEEEGQQERGRGWENGANIETESQKAPHATAQVSAK